MSSAGEREEREAVAGQPAAAAAPRKLVRSPQAVVRWAGDVLQITTPDSDRNVEAEGLAVLRLVTAFSQPAWPHEVAARFPREPTEVVLAAIAELQGAGVLIEFDESGGRATAHRGPQILQPEALAIGQRCPFDLLSQKAIPGGIALFGAPCEVGASGDGGARHGPQLIRGRFPIAKYFGSSEAGAQPSASREPSALRPAQLLDLDGRRSFPAGGLPVLDLGSVVYRIGESLADFGARLSQVVRAVLEVGMIPVMLGGDHSLSHFPLSVIAEGEREFGILHFDAHSDLYDDVGADILTHANFLLPVLASGSLRRVHQIGLRGFQMQVHKQRAIVDPRISYVSAREVARRTPEQVFAGLPRDIPYYLTFDIDCMNPLIAPETGTRVIGGLDYYDALDLIDYAGRNFRLIGADFVEVALRPESAQSAATIAAHLLAELLLSLVPSQPLSSYFLRGLSE